jgi:hypothetical protein
VRGRTQLGILGLLVFIVTSAAGAESDPVLRAKDLYSRGEYLVLIDFAETVFSDTLGLARGERAELYRILASSYVAVGNTESAKERFKKMLELEPETTMDPLTTSPKILSAFTEAKSEYDMEHAHLPGADSLGPVRIEREMRTDVWVRPALESLLVPGLGQFDNGEHTKGLVFVASEVLSVAGLLTSQAWYEAAREDYALNTDPLKMEELYAEYNKWYMVRNGFIVSSVGICLVSSVDAIIGAFRTEIRGESPRVGFIPLRGGACAYIAF